MNKHVALCAVILIGSNAQTARAQPSPADCQESVRGEVIDADLDRPIVDAGIAASDRTAIVRTDADGAFTLDGVCPGSVDLTVSKASFTTARRTISVPAAAPIRIRMSFAMQSVTIVAPLADPLANLGFEDTLDAEALVEVRGLSLADALSRTSGVQVLRSGAIAKPVIDGFFGNRILIVNDGLRHHAQLWALDHAPEIDPFSADRLTVVRGADGVRFGADAIGGVILIDPLAFIDPSEPGLRGEANLVGISNGLQGIANFSLVTTVPGAPRWSIRAQGSAKKAGSLEAPDYALDNTGAEDFAGGAAIRYLGRGWQATVSASHLSTEYGIFTGIRSESLRDFEDAIALGEPRNVDLFNFSYGIDRAFSRVDHTVVQARTQMDLGTWGTLRLRYGYQLNDRREFDTTRVPTTAAQLTFELQSHTVEAVLAHRIGQRFVGQIGVSGLLQFNDHEGTRLIPDYDRWVGGIFGVERYQGDDYEVAIGLRYERQALDTEQPARVAASKNPPERFSLDFEALMATLGLSYTPQPQWRFDVHIAAASRIPTIDELFIDGLIPGEVFFIEGDRNLNPERTINFGLGVGFVHRWLDAEATAYVHRIADFIYRAPALDREGNPDFKQLITGRHPALEYRNVDALYAGGSVSVDLHPVDWLSFESEATYVRARNLTDGGFLINIPADTYTNRLTLRPPTWGPFGENSLWVESIVVRRQDEFDINADFQPPPPAYQLINAGLGTTFSIGGQPIRTSVDIQNLTNAAYRDYLSRLRFFADEPGISAILRLSLPFDASFDDGSKSSATLSLGRHAIRPGDPHRG